MRTFLRVRFVTFSVQCKESQINNVLLTVNSCNFVCVVLISVRVDYDQQQHYQNYTNAKLGGGRH